MKHYLLIMIMALLAVVPSCAQSKSKKNVVEVVYFHGKQRCLTCRAIEKNAREVVSEDFAKQVKQGKVKFVIVDISTPDGEKMADKYKVTWSSLFVNKWKNGKEVSNNLTEMSFKNARSNVPLFKKTLKDKINEMLR